MRVASDTIAPRPTPGKTNTLLACPISTVRPSCSTDPNGLPVAISARPSVQRRRSIGRASVFAVGFESGRMIGRGVPAAIARIIGSVNVPGTPVVPTRTVGCHAATTAAGSPASARSSPCGRASTWPAARARRFVGWRSSRRSWTRPCVSSRASMAGTSASGMPASTSAARTSRAIPMPAAPAPTSRMRCASIGELEVPDSREDAADHHGRGALHVVVEARHPVAVAVEDAERVVVLEVLPLDHAARPDLLDAAPRRRRRGRRRRRRAAAARGGRCRAGRRAGRGCRCRRPG